MACPASVVLSDGIEDTAGDAAKTGTVAHFIAEQCLTRKENASSYVGVSVYIYKEDGEEITSFAPASSSTKVWTLVVDSDMAAGVQVYLDYVRSVATNTKGELLVEIEVPLEHLTGEKDATGTSDVIILTPTELIVVDLKFGHNRVDAERNKQMLMYASGALATYGLVEDFQTVRMVIVQPNVSSEVSEWDCSIDELHDFENLVRLAAAKVLDMKAGKSAVCGTPDAKACKYCKAKPCAALDALVAKTTGIELDGLGDALDKLELVEDWVKAKQAQAFDALQAGKEVVGALGAYKLVRGKRGSRAWSDPDEVEKRLKAARVKQEVMYTFKLASPTQLEKVLTDKPRVLKELMGTMVVQPEGGLSIAPANDKRAAVEVTPAADMFEALA
jgi:hypothetical protein